MKRLLALTSVLMSFALPAFSHSVLITATPAESSVLTEFPTEISLTFNESLLKIGSENPNEVTVTDSAGEVLSGVTTVNGPTISAPLEINGNGTYTVNYRVVSADGHVIKDDYTFNVESEVATAVPISQEIEETPAETGPSLLVRSLMTLAAGLAFLLLLRARNRK